MLCLFLCPKHLVQLLVCLRMNICKIDKWIPPDLFLMFNILVISCVVISLKWNYLQYYGTILFLIRMKKKVWCTLNPFTFPLKFIARYFSQPLLQLNMIVCFTSGQWIAGGTKNCHFHAWTYSLIFALFPLGWIERKYSLWLWKPYAEDGKDCIISLKPWMTSWSRWPLSLLPSLLRLYVSKK